jgi:hypothetical protein
MPTVDLPLQSHPSLHSHAIGGHTIACCVLSYLRDTRLRSHPPSLGNLILLLPLCYVPAAFPYSNNCRDKVRLGNVQIFASNMNFLCYYICLFPLSRTKEAFILLPRKIMLHRINVSCWHLPDWPKLKNMSQDNGLYVFGGKAPVHLFLSKFVAQSTTYKIISVLIFASFGYLSPNEM